MEDNNASSSPGNDVSGFTVNETKLICAVMQNLTSEIQFDVDKVALELGYKSGSSLRARWNTLKRTKITGAAANNSTGGVDKTTPSKKAKSTPKKAKAADGEEGAETPKPTGKKGKNTKTKVKAENEDEDTVESIEGSSGVAVSGGKGDGEE